MQMETGDITPMISTPIDSRMLPSMVEMMILGLGLRWISGEVRIWGFFFFYLGSQINIVVI
ncbi:hypothetical protein Hanom_Chr06g00501161 [Helianthus anomalus]